MDATSFAASFTLLWNTLPEQPRCELEKSIITELDSRRATDGLITVETPVRYVLADVAPHRHTSAGKAR